MEDFKVVTVQVVSGCQGFPVVSWMSASRPLMTAEHIRRSTPRTGRTCAHHMRKSGQAGRPLLSDRYRIVAPIGQIREEPCRAPRRARIHNYDWSDINVDVKSRLHRTTA